MRVTAALVALMMAASFFACSPAEGATATESPAFIDSTPSASPALTAAPTATTALTELVLYLPDKTGVGLVATVAQGEDSPQGLLSALVTAGALPDVDYGRNITCTVAEEELQYTDATLSGVFVHLDLSDAFAAAVKATDANGERLMLQSLVNTFLTHYRADGLLLSIAGTDLETVNGRYDRPISFDKLAQTRQTDPVAP
jgi:hypothetical protein